MLKLYSTANATLESLGTGSPYVYNHKFETTAARSDFGFPADPSATHFACLHSVGFGSSSVYDTSNQYFEVLNPTFIVETSDSSSSEEESSASTLRLGLAATGIALAGALF
jgi:hypothetical protein